MSRVALPMLVDMAHVRSLRRQVEAFEAFRDAMAEAMDAERFDALGRILAPTIDQLLHDLGEAEDPYGYQPYPHPIARRWWDALPAGSPPTEENT